MAVSIITISTAKQKTPTDIFKIQIIITILTTKITIGRHFNIIFKFHRKYLISSPQVVIIKKNTVALIFKTKIKNKN